LEICLREAGIVIDERLSNDEKVADWICISEESRSKRRESTDWHSAKAEARIKPTDCGIKTELSEDF
jgi:hypothetical protein